MKIYTSDANKIYFLQGRRILGDLKYFQRHRVFDPGFMGVLAKAIFYLVALVISNFVLLNAAFSQTTTCSTATTITPLSAASCTPSTAFNISGTGTGPAFSTCNGATGNTNNWGKFVAIGSSTTISYDPPILRDAMIFAYSGSCAGTLTQIGCVNNSSGGGQENLTIATLPGTTYFFRIVRYNSTGTMNGNICISSPPPALTATSLSAFGNICANTTGGPNTFTITGSNLTTVNVAIGSLNGFSYSTTSAGPYTTSLSIAQLGGSFSQQIFVKFTPTLIQSYNGNIPVNGGGAPSINVAASGSGVNSPPTVTTGAATALTLSSATVPGTITANGCSAVTSYGIEYSLTNNFTPGTGTKVSGGVLSGQNYTSDLTGLSSTTTYYYRSYATNSGGTVYSSQSNFITPAPTYRSQFISMSIGATTWCAGETRNVSIQIKNIGTATWNDAGKDINVGVKWNTNGANWNDYHVRVDAAGLAPGATGTYNFTIQASNATVGPVYGTPLAAGTNNLTFDVVYEGVSWFGDNNPGVGPGNTKFTSPNQTITTGPTASAGPALASICQGGTSAALGGSVGGSATGGTWSDGGVGGTFSPNSTTLNATWKPPVTYTGTATLTLTSSGGACGTATASKTQVVSASPSANAGADFAAICQGGTSLALGGSVAGSATGGTWTSSAGGTFNPGPTNLNATWTPQAAFNGTAVLTLTTSGGPCAGATDTKSQVVTASATANAGADLTAICQGGTTLGLGGAVGGSATGGTWSDGGIGGSFSTNATNLNATWTPPANYNGTATLTLTATGGSGSPTDTKLQVVNAGATSVVATPVSSTICFGSSVPLSGSGSLGGSSANLIDNFNGATAFTVTGSSSGNRSQIWQQEVSGNNVNSVATFTSPGGGSLMVSTAGSNGIFDATSVSSILTSGLINTTGFSSLSTLTFNHTYKQGGSSGSGVVQVSTNGGTLWTTLATYTSNQGSSSSFAAVSINFAAYANLANVQIRFNFNTANQNFFSNTTSWWAVDDIILNGVKVPLYSWTANTAAAINGLPVGAGTPSQANANITVTPKSSTSYTLTATNPATNCGTSGTPVVVNVNPVPTLVTLADAIINTSDDDALNCTAKYNWTHPSVNTSCPTVLKIAYTAGIPAPASLPTDGTVTAGGASSVLFSAGVTLVTYTATDQNSNIATSSFTVTVNDDETPTIACAAPVVVSNTTGECNATVTLTAPVTLDNCGVDHVVNDHPSNIFSTGTTDVTWTVVDIHGNKETCVQQVTVNDTESPTIACKADVSVDNDMGSCSAVVNLTEPVTNDNCGIASVNNDHSSNVFPVGVTNVKWTVTDNSGNVATCTQKVTVTDNESPAITCAAPVTQVTDPAVSYATINLVQPTVTDNCGVAATVNDHASTQFPIGTTFVKWTSTDIHGNSSSCTQTIVVNDTIQPSIAFNPALNLNNNPGLCIGTTTVTYPEANDNSGHVTVTSNYGVLPTPSVDPATPLVVPAVQFPVGSTTIVWTATDPSSNSTMSTQTVAVVDNEVPTITCPSDINQNNDAGSCSAVINIATPATSDNCGVASVTNDHPSNIFTVGETIVTWTVVDIHGNKNKCTQKVTVTDTELPSITSDADVSVNNDNGECAATITLTTASTNDNCGVANVTNDHLSPSFAIGTTIVKWTVTDIHGNVNTSTQGVTVTDNEKPLINVADVAVNNDAGLCSAIVPSSATATDNCNVQSLTGTRSDALALTAAYPVGTTTVTWNATDIHGNIASTQIQTIVVKDNTAPTVLTQNITVQLDATGHASVTPADIDHGSTDNCGIATRTLDISNFDCANVNAPVTVTLTITDIHGNVASTTAIVTVEDKVAPVLITHDIIVQLDATGHAAINAGDIDNGSTDNCGIATRTLDITSFDCSNVDAPVTVTLTVTDIHGNAASKTALVTVVDYIVPVVATQNRTVQLDATGHASIIAGDIDNGSSDNCGIATRTLNISSFDCANVGSPVTVTLTVTDIHGNVDSSTAVVTVEDNVAPVVLTKDITIQLDATGHASITARDVDNGSSDNCAIATSTLSKSSFDCENVGAPVTVTLTVKDIHNNSSSNTAIVTVEDHVAPVVLTKNITVQLDGTGYASITPVDIDNGSSDNCAIDTMTVDIKTFDCSNVNAPVTVTLTVTDIHGNIASNTALVTVEDKVVPVVLTHNITAQLDATGHVSITAEDLDNGSSDNCGIDTRTIDISGFDCSNVDAPVTVTLTVTDIHGNVASNTAVVTVEDKVAPVVVTQNITTQLDAAGLAAITPAQIDNGSTDNCAIDTRVLDISSFDCSNVGSPVTVTLTVTDIHGNVTSNTALVTVEDKVVPVVLTHNITAQLDATGHVSITAEDLDNGSSDNCGIDTRTIDISSFDCSNVDAPVTVTLTITDIHGNVASNTAVVTVEDKVAPVVVTQNITIQLDAAGLASISPAQIDNGSTDNCAIDTRVLDISSFNCSNVGSPVTVTLRVTDIHGNAASKTAVVTVEDKVAPVVLTKNITVQLDATGHVSITPADIDNGSADNCGIATRTLDISGFDCLNVGAPVTVTLTVTDIHGNAASKTAVVTVEDKVAPVVFTQNITIQLDAAGLASITPAQIDNGSTDNCAIDTRVLDISSFNCSNAGSPVSVTLTVTDIHGNAASKTAIVTVEDKVAPVVVTQNITIQLDAAGLASITPTQIDNGSTDNCAIDTRVLDISSFNCSNVGSPVTVTLTVTDIHGNAASKTAIVTVEDKVAPVVVTQNITIQLDAAGLASITPAQIDNGSTDNCAIDTRVLDISSFDCSNVGSPVTVTLTVTDIHGNAASKTAVVTVEDKVIPVITAAANVSVVNDPGICGATVNVTPATATDNCTVGSPVGTRSDGKVLTAVYPEGVTTITWTVSDNHGNAAIPKMQTVTVTDNERPVITVAADVSTVNNPGICGASVTIVPATATDNCAVGSPVGTRSDGLILTAIYPVGTTTINWAVTDIHGNSAVTKTQTITVTDNERPVITAAANISVVNNTGVCGATVPIVAATATDNCSVGSTTGSRSDGLALTAVYPVGLTTITWAVTDINGNAAITKTQTVTVTDNERPVITTAANINVVNNPGVCGATVTIVPATATDNCSVGSPVGTRSDALALTAVYPVGVTTITWAVTDNHDNAALTKTQTVTVTDNERPVITVCAPSVTLAPNNANCTAILPDYRNRVTATDNCTSPVTLTQSPVAGTALPLGANTITITAKDAVGNSSTCTFVVTVTKTLDVTVTNSNPQLYFGYSLDQSTVIKGSPTGGVAPYKVVITMNRPLGCNAVTSTGDELWQPSSGGTTTGGACPSTGSGSIPVSTILNVGVGGSYSVTATLMANAVFTVTVTDANGCITSKTTTVNSEDARCFAGNSGNAKVKICHRTGNANDACHELCVAESAVAAHLAHGDFLGSCTPNCVAPPPPTSRQAVQAPVIAADELGLEVMVMPNPTPTYFNVNIKGKDLSEVKVRFLDVYGKVLKTQSQSGAFKSTTFGADWAVGTYFVEVIQGKERKIVKVIKAK